MNNPETSTTVYNVLNQYGLKENDDQPITREWVEAEFGSRVMNSYVKEDDSNYFDVISILCTDEGVKLCIDPTGDPAIEHCVDCHMPWIKTRGDLRLLLRAFKWDRPE